MRFVCERRRNVCICSTILHEGLPVHHGLVSYVCSHNEGLPFSGLVVQLGAYAEIHAPTDKGYGLRPC